MGGFRYRELKSDPSGIQLWTADSCYGDTNNPNAGYSVTIKSHLHLPYPTNGLSCFDFSKSELQQAELLFEALVNASPANRPGLGRGYIQDLRRIQYTKPPTVPLLF